MKRFILSLLALFLLLMFGAFARAAKPRPMTYGMPRMQHKRQTVKPYHLETKQRFSPCKHRRRKNGVEYPTQCFVQ